MITNSTCAKKIIFCILLFGQILVCAGMNSKDEESQQSKAACEGFTSKDWQILQKMDIEGAEKLNPYEVSRAIYWLNKLNCTYIVHYGARSS